MAAVSNIGPTPSMHLFINSLAASAGGGLTYIRNVIPHLAARTDARVTSFIPPKFRFDFHDYAKVDLLELKIRRLADFGTNNGCFHR